MVRFHQGSGVSGAFFFMIVGIITIFLAGMVACCEVDIKKTIAISTLRQLGLMFVFLSLGEEVCAFFHISTHALFKSLLFMTCGVYLFLKAGDQDFRAHGGAA